MSSIGEQTNGSRLPVMQTGQQSVSSALAATSPNRIRLKRHGRFLPTLPSQQLADLLAAADVLLVTQRNTVSDMSLPSKVASYAAVGVPIVASVDAGSETAHELNDDGIGLVVEPGKPEALARAVEAVARRRSDSDHETRSHDPRGDAPNDPQQSLSSIAATVERAAGVERVRNTVAASQ